jgi:hypothetical protein
MKKVFAVLFLTIGMVPTLAKSEIVTVPIQAKVSTIRGTPFGITAQPFVTTVTGSFAYDSTTPPRVDFVINSANYPATIPNGFMFQIGTATVTSSEYEIQARNDLFATGQSEDSFDAAANPSGFNGMGGDFRVNGVETKGLASMRIVDLEGTFYASSADVDVLPTHAQLDQADYVSGFLGDDTAPGGAGENYLIFGTGPVPEPGALLLAVQTFALLTFNRTKRLSTREQL